MPEAAKAEPKTAPPTPEPAAEWVDPATLIPWKDNPKKITNAEVKELADVIRRFGFGPCIVARKANREIIAGHKRHRASLLLKSKAVPVRFMDVNEREAHLMAIADNKQGENTEWDDLALANVMSDYGFGDALLAGFDAKDLGKMADAIHGTPEPDAGPQLGSGLTYSVIVECADEEAQAKLLERLEIEGFSCKPLVT